MRNAFIPARLTRSAKAMVKTLLIAIATVTLFFTSDLVLPQSAAAYPFWAQQTYPETPREATGRIVCANCHLAAKLTEVEIPQSILPDTVFKAVVKIPYDTSVQQVGADGSKTGLNVGAVLMLPDGFKIAPEDRIPTQKTKKTLSSSDHYPVNSIKKSFSQFFLPTPQLTRISSLVNIQFTQVVIVDGDKFTQLVKRATTLFTTLLLLAQSAKLAKRKMKTVTSNT
jgi:hypothetical protein